MLHWIIPTWCQETVTMKWFRNCQYLSGRWVYGTLEEKSISASVQNPASNLRQFNGEGTQDIENLVLFTNEDAIQLIQAGGQDSVYFEIKGKLWFMTAWERWNYLMPHYRVTLVGQNMLPFPTELQYVGLQVLTDEMLVTLTDEALVPLVRGW